MEGTHCLELADCTRAEPRAEAAGLGRLPVEMEANYGLLFG